MQDKLTEILDQISALEKELLAEVQKKQQEFMYTIRERKVYFDAEVRRRHKELAALLADYVYESGVMIILTVPVIWGALLPALLLDIVVSIYQFICFPVYGIPKVKRQDYIVIDRHALRYLNILEKVNCAYCGYFNGLIAYVQEVAGRTEQYWCPIRHARRMKAMHSRYRKFFDYGDAEGYRKGLKNKRKDFKDCK